MHDTELLRHLLHAGLRCRRGGSSSISIFNVIFGAGGSQRAPPRTGIRCYVKWERAGGAPQRRRAPSRGPCAGRWHPACGEPVGVPSAPIPVGCRRMDPAHDGDIEPASGKGDARCGQQHLCKGWWPHPEPSQPASPPGAPQPWLCATTRGPGAPGDPGNWSFAPGTGVTVGSNWSLGNSAGGPRERRCPGWEREVLCGYRATFAHI